MKCPNDGAVLTMTERSGVEIDYCPECRGVWLDRGELDKILDRAAADVAPVRAQPDYQERPQAEYRPTHQPDQGRGYQQPRRPKRKEHWLSELFD
jgi:Zn-finger nucleic acid-binding protein